MWLRRVRPATVIWGVAVVTAAVLVLMVHGFAPGMAPVPLTASFAVGAIDCLRDQGWSSLHSWCMSVGLPVGEPRLTGLPEVYAGWVVSYLPGFTPWRAHQLTMALMDLGGLSGSLLLLRRWSVARWIAIPAAVSYAIAPNVIVLNGFPYTFEGYLALPLLVWAALVSLDRLMARRWVSGVLIALAVSLFTAFTDGYVFFGLGLLVGVLAVGRAVQHRRAPLPGLIALAVWIAALGTAALTYVSYVPGHAYETDVGINLFEELGADVVGLVLPSVRFLAPSLFPGVVPAYSYWGINVSPPTYYLGAVAGALILGLIIFWLRRRWTASREGSALPLRESEVAWLLVAGAIAVVLSFGPTLKIGDMADGLHGSVFPLPTGWLYEHAPGFSDIRASNRWLIPARLAVVLGAAVALGRLWSGWAKHRPWRAVALAVLVALCALDIAPNPMSIVRERSLSEQKMGELRSQYLPEARKLLHPGERVLFLPSGNDFLANYLVPLTDTTSYNVGGDKNYYLSTAAWPADVKTAQQSYGQEHAADTICSVLEHDANAVVLMHETMHQAPLLSPPDLAAEAWLRAEAGRLAADPRFAATTGTRMTVLRLKGGC